MTDMADMDEQISAARRIGNDEPKKSVCPERRPVGPKSKVASASLGHPWPPRHLASSGDFSGCANALSANRFNVISLARERIAARYFQVPN
jgi:hypothetical protein